MRAVVQRVDRANVTVDEKITGEVQKGLLVLLGVAEGDTDKDLAYIIDKVCGMRIFEDEAGKMNLSVKDVGGAILAVSQFTNAYYERFVDGCRKAGLPVETGVFRAHMLVELVNNGPVTILLDSTKLL